MQICIASSGKLNIANDDILTENKLKPLKFRGNGVYGKRGALSLSQVCLHLKLNTRCGGARFSKENFQLLKLPLLILGNKRQGLKSSI